MQPWCRSVDDELRTYLKDGGALPARLAREFGDDDSSLASLSNWSFTQRWAWNELQRRLRVCLDQGRPLAGVLALWAATVAVGRTPPRHNANEDRDWRVLAVANVLMRRGYSERAAVHMVASEINRSAEAAYSALRKIRLGPMARVRKTGPTFT